ncbi:allantoinase PuuE [Rhodobacteraceae bacterium 2CG4]|uniref:Chitooligosaccharide deacetylase n=1 Tax=Halovulum marinum TaxID=2662447 RepID=A0A6L5Z1G9_9RHOB|nr:allantoinase PuuE [Halovulum marinum]MSU90411.1 allantoinase PuuE [Halovulum marinum]
MPDRYPRDLHGHGPAPRDPKWPGGAKVVVQIVLNYEEGGENCLLHGDPASEAFLSEVVGAQPWPGQRHWNVETMYEYGARVGFWRLHRLLTQMNVPVTVYGVAAALARSPAQVAAMQDAGWEIASHGLRWIEYKDFSEAEERAHMDEAIRLHTEVTGERPRGWYTGRCTERTLDLVTQEGGFAYAADSYADELPYWHRHGGRDQLVIPYSLDANDSRFVGAPGFSHGQDFFTYLHDAFDVMYEEGHHGPARILSVGLHCRLAGRPGRLAGLKKFLEHAKRHEGVWIARRVDIAGHWAKAHPPQAWDRPSQMDRETFVAKWGGIFENSAWVAERAYELELGPAHDTAVGMHSALARAFRAASDAERLGVLRAHPDLAGKLAAARALTPESTAEQAGAGLDMLTDAERARFAELNTRYTDRFGFPFIIAVKDHDKAGILAAFEARLENDPEDERAAACRQVERIAALRLKDRLP